MIEYCFKLCKKSFVCLQYAMAITSKAWSKTRATPCILSFTRAVFSPLLFKLKWTLNRFAELLLLLLELWQSSTCRRH